MRRRKTTKKMNKDQGPKRSEDLSREKNKQRISLIQQSQIRRHLLSGVFYGFKTPISAGDFRCRVLSNGSAAAGLKHTLCIETEGRKKDE
jgi:hypothetical protein